MKTREDYRPRRPFSASRRYGGAHNITTRVVRWAPHSRNDLSLSKFPMKISGVTKTENHSTFLLFLCKIILIIIL
ncbi:hypothetical protein EUGRSUZ_C04002 [Eucalyptus grandis]|uniref:Uncharacterized protein n=2 Tax=Eucalyptus grandis TaxID=71139 RepID=A0ACC3LKV4_EUCGR|nr:hypothetical protein EUGRSUZ_C04002 [Eucalyptus grandis]